MLTGRAHLCVFLLFALAPAVAQERAQGGMSKPNALNPFGGYVARQVPEPVLSNSPRIEQLLREGELRLSLSDALALALENNLDLVIARYNLSIADTDIQRTRAGAPVRGVATGLVQGTPGGGIGGFGAGAPGAGAGGTTGGAGGAGTGASGLVQSTLGAGAPVPSYDPELRANFSIQHLTVPLSNQVVTGVPALQQNAGGGNVSYSQAFPTGTSFTVEFDNNRVTSNSLFATLVPELRSSFRFTMRQRLLSGFGIGPNMRFIRIAHNNREISDVAFRNQVIATVAQIQNIYWDLVNSYEDVRVRERSLSLVEKTLSDNREQVRIGTLAPIEVIRAESEVALRNQELLTARTQLQLQELLMKNALTRTLSDPTLAAARVVPTDRMQLPAAEPVAPVQDLIAEAISRRPELAQARIDLVNRDISRKAAANAMLPVVDLVSWYGAAGLAGEPNPRNPSLPPGTVPSTGLGDSFSNLFRHNHPDYGVAISLSMPIRNRAAQSDQVRSQLEYRQAQVRMQQLHNQIAIEVRNAQFAVQQNRARVETARQARDLARHSFEIEKKRHALGAATSYDVLQAQRDLALSESNLVEAMSDYEKSRVELDRVTGLTLERIGIVLADAEEGLVRRRPTVPDVAPAWELNGRP